MLASAWLVVVPRSAVARSAVAQAGTAVPIAETQPTATVRGAVHDSLAAAPLGGALVQLVADERDATYGQSVLADRAGLFEFRDVPAGRYTLGFHHALLDSLGLEPIARARDRARRGHGARRPRHSVAGALPRGRLRRQHLGRCGGRGGRRRA
jgi:hypothetical protein